MILSKPSTPKDSLSNIVEIINPVFLINWEYLSVCCSDNSNIKTSTRIKIVKKSLKKTESKFPA